ncbi:MAG: hypothetical protein JSW20_12495, partial [Nitrospiraceae bacterium]
MVRDYLNAYTDLVRINIFDREGFTVYSTVKKNEGKINTSEHFRLAVKNNIFSEFIKKTDDTSGDPLEEDKFNKLDLLEVYVPITIFENKEGHHRHRNEKVIGVFEIYRDMGPMIHEVEIESFKMSTLVLMFMIVLFIFLQIILRNANNIIKRKNKEIDSYNASLEEAHKRIMNVMNEVV